MQALNFRQDHHQAAVFASDSYAQQLRTLQPARAGSRTVPFPAARIVQDWWSLVDRIFHT
jgi:hypothetical protein